MGRNKEIAIEMINGTSDNTAYTAHSVRPNFGFAKTSYMLETLYEIPNPAFEKKRYLYKSNLDYEEEEKLWIDKNCMKMV